MYYLIKMNYIKKKLNLIHKFLTSKKFYYSFSGVDVIIKNIFRDVNNGFYIDVGCQHPIKNNNTYLLHKKGWKGINIDLDEDNIHLFKIARPKDLNINIAVSDNLKDVELFFFHKKSPINTIDKKTSEFQKAKVSQIKNIKANSLTNILDNSIYKNNKIDLLTIDVEGHELNVLNGLNFNIYSPKVIVVEFLDLNVKKLEIKNLNIDVVINSELYNFLLSKNYTLTNCIYSDLVFVHNQFRD